MSASQIRAALDKLAALLQIIAGAALLGMVVVEAWQVVARYVLNDSPSWTEPVALLMMSTTMMLGAAVCVRSEAHFGFYILTESSSPPVSKALRFTARSIVAVIGLVLATYGARLMVDSWWFNMAGVSLPQGVSYLPMAVGGAAMVLFALERIVLKQALTEAQVE